MAVAKDVQSHSPFLHHAHFDAKITAVVHHCTAGDLKTTALFCNFTFFFALLLTFKIIQKIVQKGNKNNLKYTYN